MLKMYIAVLDEVPDHMVPVLVAHAVLNAHLELYVPFNEQEHWTEYPYYDWLKNSFRKCVVKVNQKEFAKIKALDSVYLGHENTVLNGEKSCAVLCPRKVWPNVIKFAKLWEPKLEYPFKFPNKPCMPVGKPVFNDHASEYPEYA